MSCSRGRISASLDLFHALHSAVHDAGLDGQRGRLLVLLSGGDELLDELRSGHRIAVAENESVRAFENRVVDLDALVLQRALHQRVLENAVINVRRAALGAQGGDGLHGQRLILDDDDGLGLLDLLLDFGNNDFLRFKILGHVIFLLPERFRKRKAPALGARAENRFHGKIALAPRLAENPL